MDRKISHNARWTSGIVTSISQYMMNRKDSYVSFVNAKSTVETFMLGKLRTNVIEVI